MALKILVRVLFVTFMSTFVLNAYLVATPRAEIDYKVAVLYTITAAFFAAAVVIFEWRFQKDIVRELVALVFGLAAGLLVTSLIVLILMAFFIPSAASVIELDEAEAVTLTLADATSGRRISVADAISSAIARAFWRVQAWIPLILPACCYICVAIVMQTRNDFRFLVPYIDFSQRGTQEGGIILDTSAIIDGRIAEVLQTRLISVPVIIPDFVIREMQTLADSSDRLKRMRGRRGLDTVSQLKDTTAARIVIRDTDASHLCSVDDELVRCAKEINARIVTTDFNLNKVSQIEGVMVINVNDLANAVKTQVTPGGELAIKILRAGQEAKQGVGYLDDGTMVVVEDSQCYIGKTIGVAVTGSIQTSAGRMIFGKPESDSPIKPDAETDDREQV